MRVTEPTTRGRISFIGSRSSRVRARLARPRLVQLEQRGAVAFLAAAADKIGPAPIPPTAVPSTQPRAAAVAVIHRLFTGRPPNIPRPFHRVAPPSWNAPSAGPLSGRAMLSGERSVVRRPRLGPISTGAWPCFPHRATPSNWLNMSQFTRFNLGTPSLHRRFRGPITVFDNPKRTAYRWTT